MANAQSKTLTPLLILRILEQYSDEQHPLTREDIEKILDEQYSITLERKAFFRHIEHLNELDDVDIRRVTVKTNNAEKKPCAGFYLTDRLLSDYEMRLIIDSLSGNTFISDMETKEIIERITKLSSCHFKNKIAHYKFINDRGKTPNQTLLYNLEIIEEAIETKKKIAFTPVRTNKLGEPTKSPYFTAPMTPVQTIVKGQDYYLLYLRNGNLGSYPLHQVANVEILYEPAEDLRSIWVNGIDYNRLLQEHPLLFGIQRDPELCTFQCYPFMLKDLKAYFGPNLRIQPIQRIQTHIDQEGKKQESVEDLLEVSVRTDPAAAMHFTWENLDTVWLIAPDHTNRTLRRRLSHQLAFYEDLEKATGAGSNVPKKIFEAFKDLEADAKIKITRK